LLQILRMAKTDIATARVQPKQELVNGTSPIKKQAKMEMIQIS